MPGKRKNLFSPPPMSPGWEARFQGLDRLARKPILFFFCRAWSFFNLNSGGRRSRQRLAAPGVYSTTPKSCAMRSAISETWNQQRIAERVYFQIGRAHV